MRCSELVFISTVLRDPLSLLPSYYILSWAPFVFCLLSKTLDMDLPTPTFRKPDYDPESDNGTSHNEAATGSSDINISPALLSKRAEEEDEIDPKTTRSDEPHTYQLKFTESSHHVQEKIIQKLDLHHGTSCGPSEARQERQSLVVVTEDALHIPL